MDKITGEEKKGIGLSASTSNPATELIEIGKAKAIGAINDDCICIRDIDAAFDDGGGEQDIGFALDKGAHDHLEFVFFHLAVTDDDAGLWYEVFEFFAH